LVVDVLASEIIAGRIKDGDVVRGTVETGESEKITYSVVEQPS